MKRVLIIGAGFLQSFLIKKAKDLGYETLTVDKNPCSLGFNLADDYKVIDIVDVSGCLEYAKSQKIDGVITAATDYGVLTAAYIARSLGLQGLSFEAATRVKNKYLVRQTLFENNIDDISQYFIVENVSQINQIKGQINYPVMVKPCDGSGSKAATRVNSPDDLENACLGAIGSSLLKKALIEDFIVGTEYGVESFVFDSNVFVLGIMEKQMTAPPSYAELGHAMPSGLINEDKIKQVVINAIHALDINYGAVNMDILVSQNGKVYIIDIGARMGGNLIGSHIIPLSTGIDYMSTIIKSAVADDFGLKPNQDNQSVATRILALQPGIIKQLPDFKGIENDYEVKVYPNIKAGDTIRPYLNNLDGCGYVLAVGSYKEDCLFRAEEAKNAIDEGIVRV